MKGETKSWISNCYVDNLYNISDVVFLIKFKIFLPYEKIPKYLTFW